MSLNPFPGASAVAGAAAATGAEETTIGAAATAGWSPAPFCNLRRKPSFSISKTERSFFRIKSMMALMSLSSTAAGRVRRLGKALFLARSSQRIGGKIDIYGLLISINQSDESRDQLHDPPRDGRLSRDR